MILNEVERIVWTCMWCGGINVYMWDEPGFAENTSEWSGNIFMRCEHADCGRETKMGRAI